MTDKLKVVSINNAKHSAHDFLTDALNDVDIKVAKKVVLLALNDSDDCYGVSLCTFGMRRSEVVSLCNYVAHDQMHRIMGTF